MKETNTDEPKTLNLNPAPTDSLELDGDSSMPTFTGDEPESRQHVPERLTRAGQHLPTFGNPEPYIREKKAAKAKKTAKAKRHKCERCDRNFATGHGLSVHKYRMHSPKGKSWAKKTAKANRDTAAAKKTAAPKVKVWGKKPAKKLAKKPDNSVLALKAMDAATVAEVETLVLRVGDVVVTKSGSHIEIKIGR